MQDRSEVIALCDQQLANTAAAITNLARTGLYHPDAVIAYRAALGLRVGNQDSWEAARQAQLFAIRAEVRAAEAHGRRTRDTETTEEHNLHASELSQAEQRFELTFSLPNPFAMFSGRIAA